MYSLVLIFALLSPATGSGQPVALISQNMGKFETMDECKAAANQPIAFGTVADLNLSNGFYWFCAYGAK